MSIRLTATVVCCILTQILCVVSQKSFSFVPQTHYRGSAPGPRCGPQTPSLLLCPPNNPVKSTPLAQIELVLAYRLLSTTLHFKESMVSQKILPSRTDLENLAGMSVGLLLTALGDGGREQLLSTVDRWSSRIHTESSYVYYAMGD